MTFEEVKKKYPIGTVVRHIDGFRATVVEHVEDDHNLRLKLLDDHVRETNYKVGSIWTTGWHGRYIKEIISTGPMKESFKGVDFFAINAEIAGRK